MPNIGFAAMLQEALERTQVELEQATAENERLRAENEQLRAALTDLCSQAETFTLVAAYQGTPLTALSNSVEAAWRVLYG